MKRLLLILCMLTGVAYGQLYQAMPQPGYGPVKAFWIDSVLSIPTNVTSGTNLSGGRDVGKIRYNIPDSSLQAWTGYQWRSGGSGTTPTWQQTLDATNGKILTSNNSIQSNGSYVFEMFNNERAAIRFDNTTTITSLGDVDATVYGNKLAIHDNDSKAYFINADSTSTVSAIKLGVNTSIPDSTLHVVGGIFGTRGLRLSSLTNLSTQNRLLGQFGTDGNVGYITATSPLSISSGALTCPTCVTSAAALTANSLMIGGGLQASSTTTTASGILTWLGTPSSANLRSALTDENGTGVALFDAATTPTFTTGIRIGGAAASRKMLVGNGTNFVASTETWAVPGTTGNILLSDGTNWTSSATSALTGLPYWALTGTSILTGATTVDINDNDFTISDAGSGSHNILLSANTGQSEITIDGLNKSITLNATNNTIVTSPGVQFSAYGAGALTTDGSGNITPVSDRNAKHNIQSFNYGLNSILGLKTSSFIYNQDKSNTLMSGFIAQDVQRVIPIAVHKGKDGMLSLETNAILAALVNSVKELKELNDKQQKEINNLKQIIKNK